MKDLTQKQKRFVLAYAGEAYGNASRAAKIAGYSDRTSGQIGDALLKNVKVAEAIANETKKDYQVLIATREDRQRWWTKVMYDGGVEMEHRLKAAETLARACGDFLHPEELIVTHRKESDDQLIDRAVEDLLINHKDRIEKKRVELNIPLQ